MREYKCWNVSMKCRFIVGDYIQFDAVLCRSTDKSLASKSLRAFIDINTINHAGEGIVWAL